jgi:hypothetical protein
MEKVMSGIQDGISQQCTLSEITANLCQEAKLAWWADLPIETAVDDCTIAILKLSHTPDTEK